MTEKWYWEQVRHAEQVDPENPILPTLKRGFDALSRICLQNWIAENRQKPTPPVSGVVLRPAGIVSPNVDRSEYVIPHSYYRKHISPIGKIGEAVNLPEPKGLVSHSSEYDGKWVVDGVPCEFTERKIEVADPELRELLQAIKNGVSYTPPDFIREKKREQTAIASQMYRARREKLLTAQSQNERKMAWAELNNLQQLWAELNQQIRLLENGQSLPIEEADDAAEVDLDGLTLDELYKKLLSARAKVSRKKSEIEKLGEQMGVPEPKNPHYQRWVKMEAALSNFELEKIKIEKLYEHKSKIQPTGL